VANEPVLNERRGAAARLYAARTATATARLGPASREVVPCASNKIARGKNAVCGCGISRAALCALIVLLSCALARPSRSYGDAVHSDEADLLTAAFSYLDEQCAKTGLSLVERCVSMTLPGEALKDPDAAVIEALRKKGVRVRPVTECHFSEERGFDEILLTNKGEQAAMLYVDSVDRVSDTEAHAVGGCWESPTGGMLMMLNIRKIGDRWVADGRVVGVS